MSPGKMDSPPSDTVGVGSPLAEDEPLQRVLAEVLDAAIAITRSDFGNIQLLDPVGGHLKIVAVRGLPEWWCEFWNSAGRGSGACGTALARRERVVVEDVEESPIFFGTPALDIQRRAGIRAVQSTPLVDRTGNPIGMFSTHCRRPHRPDEAEARLLDLLARHAAAMIERVQADLALREGEERFRTLIEHAPVALAMFDADMRYLAVSRRWLRDYGLGEQDLTGRSHYEVFPDIPERWKSAHRRGLAGEVVREREDRFESIDGTVEWHNWEVRPWRKVDGTVGGLVLFTEDVTERKQTEAEISDLRAEMESLTKSQIASQTAAAIAHEINQPLSACASYAEAALRLAQADGQDSEPLRHALEGSARQAQRAGAVVRELLQFFQAGEGAIGEVQLAQAIPRALALVEGNGHGGFHAVVDLAPDLRPVRANRVQIEKVLVNLLRNSVDAMRGAGVEARQVTITVRAIEDDGNRAMARVTVQDCGPGLREEEIQHIFMPFCSGKPAGIGMGLAISRSLIEANGGRLWCEPAAGGGIFHFTVPFFS